MAKKLRTYAPAEPEQPQRAAADRAVRGKIPPPAPPERRASEPQGAMALQRSLGNAAMRRIARTLRSPYGGMAEKLAMEASRAGKFELLEAFGKLSSGQKIAALKAMKKTAGNPFAHAADAVDWEAVLDCIQFVRDVPIKEDEAIKEGEIPFSGTEPPNRKVNANGLLTPYREIALWLGYKANRQGREDVARAFDALSVPQKKLAVHRMAKGKLRKPDPASFGEALTVRVHERDWIDWDAVIKAMREAKESGIDRLDPQQQELVLEMLEAEPEELEERDFSLAALLAGLAALSGESGGDRSFPEEGQLEDLGRFLAAGNREAVVDLYLGVPPGASPEQAKKEREKRLKERGFKTVEQCYLHAVEELAGRLYELAVVQNREAYVRFLERFGFRIERGKQPDAKQIAGKFK